MLFIVQISYVSELPVWYHFMLESPASAASELSDDHITIAKQVDVEVDVTNGLEYVSSACIQNVDWYGINLRLLK